MNPVTPRMVEIFIFRLKRAITNAEWVSINSELKALVRTNGATSDAVSKMEAHGIGGY